MITCPECGQAAPDDGKFCDRCGRGLAAGNSAPPPPTRPTPLGAGATLEGGIEIIEIAAQTSIENRYRARRTHNGKVETISLRERFGPEPSAEIEDESLPAPTQEPAHEEDPNGPRAKTAELRPVAAESVAAPANGTSAAASNENHEASDPTAAADVSRVESAERIASAAEPAAPLVQAASDLSAAQSTASDGHAAENFEDSEAADGGDGAAAEIETRPEPTIETNNDAESIEHVEPAARAQGLGEVFGRVLALSQMVTHPAFQRATAGFSANGRVYLVYPDEQSTPLVTGTAKGVAQMSEPEAIAAAVQICQAISFVHRRALRLNDICPESIAVATDGRLKLTGLDYVSNDNELQAEPIFNDGYTAPEIYRGKKADKRADIFSAGALLYTWLTGERIPSESWREEPGPVRFYPPHVVAPKLEQAVRRAIAFNPADRWQTIDEFKAELIKLGGAMKLQTAAMTDVGRVREHNEDSVLAVEYTRESMVDPAESYLYVVADGMGGAEAGEIASAIAVETIRGYVENKLTSGDDDNAAAILSAALEEANSRIIEYVASHPESRGMGSTGVTALVVPPDAAVAWVGDSRAYLMEGATLRQVTKDHSLVQRLVEIGQITADEARTHEHKNVITRSLGARQSGAAGAEAVAFKLKRGDKLLLCSDGLTAHLEDSQVRDILGRSRDPHHAARELIVAANAGGGTDNITVVVVFAS